MRLLFSGATICSPDTLKRLALVADEIGFMDRPSVTFRDWGTIGAESQIRRFDFSDSPVAISAHAPPSGPVTDLYLHYIEADLRNPTFIAVFLDGLAKDDRFAGKFIQPDANYGAGKGSQIRAALVADETLLGASFEDPFRTANMFQFEKPEDRHETLKVLIVEASIHVTNAMVVSNQTGLVPVADDVFLGRLLGLRSSERTYLNETPRIAPSLALAVARAVVPDQVLAQLSVAEVLEYRKETRDAYRAWTVEIDRLAAGIDEIDPAKAEREIPRLIDAEIKPSIQEYRNDMAAVRDRLFADLIKKVTKWEVPTLSLTFLAGVSVAGAIGLFASALVPSVPAIVDYYRDRRDIGRRNSMSYLISLGQPE